MSAYKDAVVDFEIGGRGDFIVEVDGKVIFSNKEHEDYRFPYDGEIVDLISKA